MRRRHLLTLAALSQDELRHLVCRSCEFAAGASGRPLAGLVVGVYFRVTSTRTRTAFSSGAIRLGASVIAFGPDDLQVNTGETVEDTGRVLSGMLDGLVVRTAGDPSELRTLASQERMAVINAMSADEHPTQALADLATMMQRFGDVRGRRVLYVGEGNNTASALALAMARVPRSELWLRTPAGYGLPGDTVVRAAAIAGQHGARVDERHDLRDLPPAVDVVYTTRWQTTGTSKPDADWRTAFAPFRVDGGLIARWPEAVFLHDLPAHRGEEVTAEVLDGPASLAFAQAENKLYSAMAVLEWCLAPC